MLAAAFLLIVGGFFLVYAGIRGVSLPGEILRIFGGTA